MITATLLPEPNGVAIDPQPERRDLSALLQLLTDFGPLDRAVHDLAPTPLRWINASRGQELVLIPIDAVAYFQADTKYTRVVTADGEALIRRSLRSLQDDLDPGSFWQIHRSTIVNAHAVAGASRTLRGWVVRLKARPERLAISERHLHRFHQM